MPLQRGLNRLLRLRPRRASRARPWHPLGSGLERLEPRVLLAGTSPAQALVSISTVQPMATVREDVPAGTAQLEWTIGASTPGSSASPAPSPTPATNTVVVHGLSTFSTSSTAVLPGLSAGGIGLEIDSPGPYTVSGASLDPAALNAALQSASLVPSVPHFALADTLSPNEALDLYRIPVEPGASNMSVALAANAPSRWLPSQVWLMNNEGQVLALWHVPANTQSLSLSLHVTPEFHESSIIFGVSRGETTATNISPFITPSFFELVVARSVGPAADTDTPFVTALSPGSAPAAPPLFVPLTQGANALGGSGMTMLSGSISAAAGSSIAPSSSSDFGSIGGGSGAIVPGQLAVGPLPARSAAPSGGTLADGDPVPPVDQLDELMVDVSLLDLLPTRADWLRPNSAASVGVPAPDQSGPQTAAPLVSLEGAGGFPLLAATLSEASAQASAEAMSPEALEALLSSLPLVEPASHGCGGGGGGSSPATQPALLAGQAIEQGEIETARRKRGRFVLGLNVAATLAFGLLLPDLVAALQQIEPRRPLPRVLRKKGQPEADD